MQGAVEMTEQIYGGDDAQPVRAKWFIPCFVTGCYVMDRDGNEIRSQMQLQLRRRDGVMLRRPFNDGPAYKCERVGCYFHEHPRGLHEINGEWIRDADRWERKRGEHDELTNNDMETMI